MPSLKRLTRKTAVLCQQSGQFDEHLITLYSVAYGVPYTFNDTYTLYVDKNSNILYISLFGLNGDSDPIQCLETATEQFIPKQVVVTSPTELPPTFRTYRCVSTGFDRDYS